MNKDYFKILDPLNKLNNKEIYDISSLLNVLYNEDSRNNDINNLQNFILFSYLNDEHNLSLKENWKLFKILLMRYLFEKDNKLCPYILNRCIKKLNKNLDEIDFSNFNKKNIFLFYEIISITYFFYLEILKNEILSHSIINLIEIFSTKIIGNNRILDNIIREFDFKFCLNNHISKDLLNYFSKKNFEINFSKLCTIKKLIQKKYPDNNFLYPNPLFSKEIYDNNKSHENINILLEEDNKDKKISNLNQLEEILLDIKKKYGIIDDSTFKVLDSKNNLEYVQSGFYVEGKKYISLKFFLPNQITSYQSHIFNKINLNGKLTRLFFYFENFLIRKIKLLNSNYELTFLIINYIISKYNKLVESIRDASFKKYKYDKINLIFSYEKEKKEYPKFNEEKLNQFYQTDFNKLINGFKTFLLEYLNYILKSIKNKEAKPETLVDEKFSKKTFIYSITEIDNKFLSLKKIDDLIEKKNKINLFNLNI